MGAVIGNRPMKKILSNSSFALKVAILPLAVLALQTQISYAADGVELTDNGLELTVTANRRVTDIDKTLASVTVITRKKIEESQTQDIVDLLRQQRGISISRTGGVGSQTSVFMRGTESDHVLVLLDGVRIASNTTGFDWSQLPIDQVDRIEIVRGPRAALYGSDAIGGVIEISTRKDARSYASVTIGRYDTKKVSAGLSSADENSRFSLNVSKETSDGFSATNSNAPSYAFDADKDAHTKTAVNLSFSEQLNDKIKVGLDLFKGDNDIDFDIGSSETSLETISSYLESELTDKWSQKLQLSHAKNQIVSTSSFSEFSTQRKEFNWQNNFSVSNDTSIIGGVNYRKESGKTASISSGSISNKAIYANVNKNNGTLSLDLSARYDDHSRAGEKVTGQFAVGYNLSSATTLYINYGTAFRAPNINDLYTPGADYDGDGINEYAGNLNLKPETSETAEIGFKTLLSENHRVEASIFRTNIKNLINNGGADVFYQSINVDKAKLKGLELGYAGNNEKLDWGVDLSLLRTENEATGKRLLRRPDHKIGLNLAYKINNNTRLGMDASYVGSRSDVSTEVDSYSLVNLSANHKLGKRASLGLRIENVTNEDYEVVSGYNTPKRGAYLTFTYK